MIVPKLIDDPRPIHWAESASSRCQGELGAAVGGDGVTRIVPYEENGQMAPVTWLAVYKGDEIVARLNAAEMAKIQYVEVQP